jgi:hypothetical protein
LFAASSALREQGSRPMTPDEQIYFDEQLTSLREKMDSMKSDSIWSQGFEMTMEQALELALQSAA